MMSWVVLGDEVALLVIVCLFVWVRRGVRVGCSGGCICGEEGWRWGVRGCEPSNVQAPASVVCS